MFLFSLIFGMEDYFSLPKRLPHFLYLDSFDKYAMDSAKDFFVHGRKLKLGVVLTTHTLTGLGGSDSSFGQLVSANSPTKLTFGQCTPEDIPWWETEFCKRREWDVTHKYDSDDEEYSTDKGGVKWAWKDTMIRGKIQGLAHKEVIYKIRDKYGKHKVNFGSVDTTPSKYFVKRKPKTYNFARYCLARPEKEAVEKNPKFDPKLADFDDENLGNIDPIFMNTTDSNVFFNNDDAISFNIPKRK